MQDVPTLSELEAVMVAQKVLSILRELHSLQIVHGDIKPANLIQQENGAIYLIDFGSAIFKGDAYRTYTFGYTAPECSAQTSSSPASDIYSLGRTIEYLLIPWDHRREIERQSTKAPIRFYRSDISVELEGILDLFTNPEPYLRPQNADAALELLNHYKTCNPFKKIKLQFTSHKKINTYCAQQQKRQEVVIRELDNQMLTRLRCYNNRLCACGCCMTRGCLARWTSTRRSTARARWSFMCSFPWMTKRLSGCGSGLRPWCDNLLLIQKNLSRGLAASGPLSFCQSFPRFFLHPAESGVFSKLFVDTARFLW